MTPAVRERVALLLGRLGDENDGETLAAARAIARTADLHDLAELVRIGEVPEAGSGLAQIINKLLIEIGARSWALRSHDVVDYNTLHAKFASTGRLSSSDLGRLHALHKAALR